LFVFGRRFVASVSDGGEILHVFHQLLILSDRQDNCCFVAILICNKLN